MAVVKISGRMVNFTRMAFSSNDLTQIRQELSQLMQHMQGYQGTPIIISSTVPQSLIELLQLLIEFELQPMAVIDGVLGEDARMMQFPVLPPDQPVQRITATSVVQQDETQADSSGTAAQINQSATDTIYYEEMLRTGQSLLHDHGDIILAAGLNSGAELIASGNIHIYGSARGRIIAGASGARHAHIFCQSLEAELVSIAGTYCVADDIPKEWLKKPVRITLNVDQVLEFLPLMP